MSKAKELREAMLGVRSVEWESYGAIQNVAAAICDTLGITREMVDALSYTATTEIDEAGAEALTTLLEVAGK